MSIQAGARARATVKQRSRLRANPPKPNPRQVHLIHEALHDELRAAGFDVQPGRIGENVTTRGIDLLGLPLGTLVHLGRVLWRV